MTTTLAEHTHETLGIRADLDLDHLKRCAIETSANLSTADRAVQVSLTPGDMTVYHLLIVGSRWHVGDDRPYARAGVEWIVSLLNLNGRSYPWVVLSPGDHTAEHVSGDPHTRSVVAAFLTLLSAALRS